MRQFFLFILILAALQIARAVPPEGFESYALVSRGLPATSYFGQLTHNQPNWTDPHQDLQFWLTLPTNKENYWTIGVAGTGNPPGDRSAYFIRYDWKFGESSSLALKYLHQDLWEIHTGRENAAVEYSILWPSEMHSGVYLSFGAYYSWLKQRWNRSPHIPLTFGTSDQEGFFYGTLGIQGELGLGDSYYTFDISLSNPFDFYNFDNPSFDFVVNTIMDRNTYLRLMAGTRLSSFFAGTGYPGFWFLGVGVSVFTD